ncbi:MAG: hypothetical protein FWH25_01290, partial [Syntrophorhabdaceae bacterium]|nr:hypothetical protein [Syntrophorhabdaceae bacterium]
MDRAGRLDFSKPTTGVSDPCVIVPHNKMAIVKVDGASDKHFWIPGRNIIFVPPGKHTLSVQIDTGVYAGQSTAVSSGRAGFGTSFSSKVIMPPVDIEYNFEKGKHYSLDYKMGLTSTDYIFTEITDANAKAEVAEYIYEYKSYIEDMESYLSFSRQNPNLLEGKWEAGKEKDELEFVGNNVKFMATKPPFYSTRPSLEGTFVFNQDTLITVWDKYQTVLSSYTREENPKVFQEKAVWYYTLKGDTLEIKSGEMTWPLN